MRETGLSVPDAVLLQAMAEELDVSVSQLLGADMVAEKESNDIAEQLARINEQLVIRNCRGRRIWKTILWVFVGIAGLYILLMIFSFAAFSAHKEVVSTGENHIVEAETAVAAQNAP